MKQLMGKGGVAAAIKVANVFSKLQCMQTSSKYCFVFDRNSNVM
jgi:hypothetical protein